MRFVAWYEQQPSVRTDYFNFVITIVDPCDPPADYEPKPVVIPPDNIADLTYFLTDTTNHPIPPFTSTPAQCADNNRLTYSFDPATDSSPILPGSAISFEPTTREFTVDTDEPTLAGTTDEGKPYEITVVATLPDGTEGEGTFTLTIKNPCYESSYITISPPAAGLPDQTVTLYEETTWDHPVFTTVVHVISTNDHETDLLTLCGALEYVLIDNGEEIFSMLEYDGNNREVTATLVGLSLLGNTYDYQVRGRLLNYPTTFADATGEITTADPCVNPFTFTVADSVNIESDYSEAAVFTFPVITLFPDVCLP